MREISLVNGYFTSTSPRWVELNKLQEESQNDRRYQFLKYGNKLKAKITAAAIAILPFCVAPAALAAAQPSASAVTENRALVVGSAGSADCQWTSREGGQSILLSKGSLVVISGDTPIKVEISVGTVEIPPNFEAMVQQEDRQPVTVSAIASRNTVTDEGSMECALTVCANDDSNYKVYPGKQIKLTAGEGSIAQIADVVMVKKNFKLDDYARSHPGGSLGRRLVTVENIMRHAVQLPAA